MVVLRLSLGVMWDEELYYYTCFDCVLWLCVLEDVCSCQDDNMVDVCMIVLRNCGTK